MPLEGDNKCEPPWLQLQQQKPSRHHLQELNLQQLAPRTAVVGGHKEQSLVHHQQAVLQQVLLQLQGLCRAHREPSRRLLPVHLTSHPARTPLRQDRQ